MAVNSIENATFVISKQQTLGAKSLGPAGRLILAGGWESDLEPGVFLIAFVRGSQLELPGRF